MAKIWTNGLVMVIVLIGSCCIGATELTLAGEWQFRMDPEETGIEEKWFLQEFSDRIHLPGAMAEFGYGLDVTADTKWTGSIVNRMWHDEERFAPYRDPENTKILFWLQPDKHYIGVAWYQCEVEAPHEFTGQHLTLFLERPHWETQLWVDGRFIGMQNSLSTPHEYDVTEVLPPGRHRISLRVDNTMKIDVGENAHSISDNTQGNWNGIVGRMAVFAKPKVRIDNIQVYPNVTEKKAAIAIVFANDTGHSATGVLTLRAECQGREAVHRVEPVTVLVNLPKGMETMTVDYPLGDHIRFWNESSREPALYQLMANMEMEGGGISFTDSYELEFGMREMGVQGTQFTLNNVPIYLRGTLECCIFPKTGYPPTDLGEWLRVLKIVKAHGLNHVRFHSWCPPEAAFAAADRLGVIFQVECAAWARIGDGKPVDKFIYEESDRIVKYYGNHPSFCLLAYGNEPAGNRQKEYLAEWLEYWKAKDSRRLYTSASGWPLLEESQFHVWPTPRVHAWGNGLKSRFNARPFESMSDYREFVAQHDVPIISHEIGQWCVFPNLSEIEKYTGYLKPKNFEIVRDLLRQNHLLDQAHDFLMASGKLQALAYKEEIEAALRTQGFGGFQLLDLHDFPGQGTALVGVLDPFWEEKGYITPDEFSRFCGASVPLLRMEKCVWTADETFSAAAEITHYGASALENAQPFWRIEDTDGVVLFSGQLPVTTIPKATAFPLGSISIPLAAVPAPCELRISLGIEGRADIENGWDIWVYPKNVDTDVPESIHITSRLDEETLTILADGGKVLLLPETHTVKGDQRGAVPPGFSPIFWNTFWTNFQPPHTLGILCDPDHAALRLFPTEFHSNWQWWDIIHGSQIMILNDLPKELRPVVQVIDDWTTCRRLGIVFEAYVNGGKLLVCSADISSDLDSRPVARQFRHSLLHYMTSERFTPAIVVNAAVVSSLFQTPVGLITLGAKMTASSQQDGYEVDNVIDGNPNSFWHTSWEGEMANYPHWLALDLGKEVEITGITLLPRQDMENGHIGRYVVFVSRDGREWGVPLARGRVAPGNELHTLNLKNPVKTRHIKIEAREPLHHEHPWASLAELAILTS